MTKENSRRFKVMMGRVRSFAKGRPGGKLPPKMAKNVRDLLRYVRAKDNAGISGVLDRMDKDHG